MASSGLKFMFPLLRVPDISPILLRCRTNIAHMLPHITHIHAHHGSCCTLSCSALLELPCSTHHGSTHTRSQWYRSRAFRWPSSAFQ